MSETAGGPPRHELPTRGAQRDLLALRRPLGDWLAINIEEAESVRVTDVQIPSGSGVSSETLLVDAQQTAGGRTRNVGYVVKVATPDGVFMEADMEVYYKIHRALAGEQGIPLPRAVCFDQKAAPFDLPALVLERVAGKVPQDDPPFHSRGWVKENMSVSERTAMWRDAVAVMARIHQVDVHKVSFLQQPARGQSGLEQLLRYWMDFSDWAAEGSKPTIVEQTERWLLSHLPESLPTGLAWGDARMGNMIFRGERCVAVLDWEMVSLAGAESDLAWWSVLDQSFSTSLGIPRLEGIGTPADTIALWESLTGRRARDMDYHLVFAAYRGAVVVIRLAKILRRAGLLTPEMGWLETNNVGMQYLSTLLGLEAAGAVTRPWPGLDC